METNERALVQTTNFAILSRPRILKNDVTTVKGAVSLVNFE